MPPAWAIAASVLVVLAAFVAGQQFASRDTVPQGADPGGSAVAPFAGGATRAPDISNMSAEEAATRLYDRVMRYASQGKQDSAAMFAPMAILAYDRIRPLDIHGHYDVGAISAAAGDAPAAAAEADTILKKNPTHLLGLLLAARAADLRNDVPAAARFRAQFTAALPAERAKNLKEYGEHKAEIDDALTRARAK